MEIQRVNLVYRSGEEEYLTGGAVHLASLTRIHGKILGFAELAHVDKRAFLWPGWIKVEPIA
ncbi:hypothetical protein IG193_01300 [Infirmifilum lucidum]|uniref:Uncharacterized protein n=1 Tax=Infirmifilum lucidum TaxID=2776706 RepID=A0A7L9FH57_9CREN|nr:hypothetical protein [Infirmifilum lucidum]QOJ79130.1 hypothetical protein IG193_01300 [Infirmifilum lucidum]